VPKRVNSSRASDDDPRLIEQVSTHDSRDEGWRIAANIAKPPDLLLGFESHGHA
jgi:hypothetical protein